MVSAAEMHRAFGAAEYDPGILLRNPEISERLEPYFREPVEPQPESRVDKSKEYWLRIITPLWLSPSAEKIKRVVQKLESTNVASMEPELLQRAVRALHAKFLSLLPFSIPSALPQKIPPETNATMSRYSLNTQPAPDLALDNHSNDILRMPLRESPDTTSPNSSYSPYAFPSELKSSHSSDQFPLPNSSSSRPTQRSPAPTDDRMAPPSLTR